MKVVGVYASCMAGAPTDCVEATSRRCHSKGGGTCGVDRPAVGPGRPGGLPARSTMEALQKFPQACEGV